MQAGIRHGRKSVTRIVLTRQRQPYAILCSANDTICMLSRTWEYSICESGTSASTPKKVFSLITDSGHRREGIQSIGSPVNPEAHLLHLDD